MTRKPARMEGLLCVARFIETGASSAFSDLLGASLESTDQKVRRQEGERTVSCPWLPKATKADGYGLGVLTDKIH